MSISENMVQEFTQESGNTRRLLERLPDNLSWQPHPKSMSLGRLATHLAEIPHWAERIVGQDRFDLITSRLTPSVLGSRAEILAAFERNVAVFAGALRGVADDRMTSPWAFLSDGHPGVRTAEGCRAARVRSQPPHSSPRPAQRVSQAQRRARPGHLRTVGRREVTP